MISGGNATSCGGGPTFGMLNSGYGVLNNLSLYLLKIV
jgi:hypothetical protein